MHMKGDKSQDKGRSSGDKKERKDISTYVVMESIRFFILE